jgi:hypothetical protein
MRKAMAIIVLPVLLTPLQARADWVYTTWGMTPEQVVEASGGAATLIPPAERREVAGRELDAQGNFKDGHILLHVFFGFDAKTHELTCVFYNVANELQNARLKYRLTERYGAPSGNEIAGVGIWHWSKPDAIDLQSMTGVASSVQHCRAGADHRISEGGPDRFGRADTRQAQRAAPSQEASSKN